MGLSILKAGDGQSKKCWQSSEIEQNNVVGLGYLESWAESALGVDR